MEPRVRARKVAALYDIHGNLPALEAVLEEVRRDGHDLIVVGGDVVPGPLPRETLERLLSLDVPVRFLRGNGDRAVLARMRGDESGDVPASFREVMGWTAQALAPEHADVLAAWPATLRVEVEGVGGVLFCHATPRSDTEIFTRLTAEGALLPIFDAAHADVVVCGHTHMQFDRTVGATRVVNAGSVGMPFDEPGAYWLSLARDMQLRRTAYDLEKAAARIRASPYPQAEAFARSNVLSPPSADETLDALSRVELK